MKSYESFEVSLLSGRGCFDRLKDSIRNLVYEVTYVLLKYHSTSTQIETILLVFQFLQMLSYTFHNEFIEIWKSVETVTQISNFLAYFQIIEFFRNDPTIWVTMFYVSMIFICGITVKWFIVYNFSSMLNKNYTLIIITLKNEMWILSTVLFIPVIQILLSSFSCDTVEGSDSVLVKLSLVECYTPSHLGLVILSATFIGVFLFLTFSFQLLFYEIQPYSNHTDARCNSKSNIILMIAKLVNVLLFTFSQILSKASIIIIMLAISLYQFFSFLTNYPYYKTYMNKLNLYLNLIYVWSVICLTLSLIFESSKFDGGIALFFCGVFPLSLIVYFQKRNRVMYLLTAADKFKRGENVMQQISYFLELVDNKTERGSEINLIGYIKLYEETCTQKECPLKKYSESYLEAKIEIVAYLIQHAEVLYRNGISKFSKCVPLRLSFVFFLIERLNKKYQANVELTNCESQNPNYEERFIIYRYKKILQDNNSNTSDDSEMATNSVYKNYMHQFKTSILKATSLYMEFWGHLMLKNQESEDDLNKLNSYGEMINTLIDDINKNFENMQRLRSLDQEIIRWYSEFLSEVLNHPNKAYELKNKISMVLGKHTYEDVNLLNIDMNALTSNDDSQYIVVSAREHNIGNIINISVGICSMFGYSRNELIGRSVDAVMPDIYHKGHKQVLFNRLNDYKKKSVNNINNKKERYKPTFRET